MRQKDGVSNEHNVESWDYSSVPSLRERGLVQVGPKLLLPIRM